MKIIDGKAIAKEIREEIKKEVASLSRKPGLAVILVGDDPASKVYVDNKAKVCMELGIKSFVYRLPDTTTQKEIYELVDELNKNNDVDGILVQHPIQGEADEKNVFNRITPEKDVDGFNVINKGKLSAGLDCFVPCTPLGIVYMLEHEGIKIEGKNIVIIGRSNIVGKPLAALMLRENATVTVCHSKTENIKEVCRNADILVAALGKAKFVTEDMVKEGAIVVDVGINRVDGKLCGDVDFENVSKKVSAITPVPGGVGPMTIAMLMKNVMRAYYGRQ